MALPHRGKSLVAKQSKKIGWPQRGHTSGNRTSMCGPAGAILFFHRCFIFYKAFIPTGYAFLLMIFYCYFFRRMIAVVVFFETLGRIKRDITEITACRYHLQLSPTNKRSTTHYTPFRLIGSQQQTTHSPHVRVVCLLRVV
jgi:hypothetical protein